MELSSKWDGLDRNTQRYIATIAAGSRQQSRFIALVEDYDRNVELTQIAQDSLGASLAQFGTHLTGIGAATNRVTSAWEGLYSSWTQGSAVIPEAINLFADLINILGSAGLGYTAMSAGIIALTLNMAKYAGSMVLAQGATSGFTSVQTQEAILAVGVQEAYEKQNEEIKEQIILKAANASNTTKEIAARVLETGTVVTSTKSLEANTKMIIANTAAKLKNIVASLGMVAPILAGVAAIGGLVAVIGLAITAEERHIKKLQEERDASIQAAAGYAQQARSLESLKSQYKEAYMAGEDLTGFQEQLTSQYPELAKQISFTASSYDTINQKIDEYIQKQKILQGQQAQNAIAKDVQAQKAKNKYVDFYKDFDKVAVDTECEPSKEQWVEIYEYIPYWEINGQRYNTIEEAQEALKDSIVVDKLQLELSADALISVTPELKNSDFDSALKAIIMKEQEQAFKEENNIEISYDAEGNEITKLKPEIEEQSVEKAKEVLEKLNLEVKKFENSLDNSLTSDEKKQSILEFSDELTQLVQKFYDLDGAISNIDLEKLQRILTPEQFAEYEQAVEQKKQEIIDKANMVDPETGLSPQQALQNATGHEGIATLMYEYGTEAGQAFVNGYTAATGNPEQQEKVVTTMANLLNGGLDAINELPGFEDLNLVEVFEALSNDESALDFFSNLQEAMSEFLESSKDTKDYEDRMEKVGKITKTVATAMEDLSSAQYEVDKAFEDGYKRASELKEAYDEGRLSTEEAYDISEEFGVSLEDQSIFAKDAAGNYQLTSDGLNTLTTKLEHSSAATAAHARQLQIEGLNARVAALGLNNTSVQTALLAYADAQAALAAADAQIASENLSGKMLEQAEQARKTAQEMLDVAETNLLAAAMGAAAANPGSLDINNLMSDIQNFVNSNQITLPDFSGVLGGSGGGGSSGGGGGGGSGESEAEKAAKAAKEAAEAAQEAAEAFQESIEVELEAIEKVLDKRKEALEKEIELMEEQRDEEEKSQRIQLNGFIKYLEKREELYEEHLDTLEKLADEAEKKAEEDNERLELQNEVVQDFYQNQIDAVQAKIDAINEEAEAEDRLQKLQEARDAYEQAKNTKNRLVLVQGAGWVFKRDQQKIKDTQAALETAEREKQIADLEKEIEILEEEAQKWADQAENIGKATSELEKYNEAYAQFAKLSDEERKQAYNDYVAALVQNNILNQAAIDAADRYDKESDENVEGSTAWNIEQIADHIETVEELLDKISMDYDELLEEQLTNEQFEKFLSQLGTTGLGGISGVVGDLTTSVEDFTNEYIVSYGELIAEKEKEIEAIEKAQDAWDELSDRVGKTTEELAREQELYNQYVNMSTEALSENSEAFKRLSGEIDTLAGMLQEAKNLEEQAEAMEKSAKEGYSTGGVNTYTGLAEVHGTKSKPEIVLNNSQAGMLFRFIDGLAKVPTLNKRSNIPQNVIASTTTTEDNSTSYNNCNFAITSNENSLAGLLQDVKNLSPLKRF